MKALLGSFLALALYLAPQSLVAETITFEWDPPAVGPLEVPITGYRLYLSTEAGKYSAPAGTVYGATTKKWTFTVPKSMAGKKFYAIAMSFNATDESLPSNEITFNTKGLPAPASGLKTLP